MNIDNLTDEEKNVKIAEELGIFICTGCRHQIDPECCHCGESPSAHRAYNQTHGFVPMGCTCGYDQADEMRGDKLPCPDYLNDLNAMHEAEKTIDGRWMLYEATLWTIVRNQERYACTVLNSTARQRADAFLLTLP